MGVINELHNRQLLETSGQKPTKQETNDLAAAAYHRGPYTDKNGPMTEKYIWKSRAAELVVRYLYHEVQIFPELRLAADQIEYLKFLAETGFNSAKDGKVDTTKIEWEMWKYLTKVIARPVNSQ